MKYMVVYIRVNPVKSGDTVRLYAQIVEKYKAEKGWRIRIVKHLGRVKNDQEVQAYRDMFGMETFNRKLLTNFIPLKDFSLKLYLHFGLIFLTRVLSSETGIKEVLERYTGDDSDLLLVMIISRIMNPSSDISLLNFIHEIYYPWADLSVHKDRIYRLLDKLEKNKKEMETDIFNALKPDVSVVHYDLTSSYFEGEENNDLVLFGYSRDKKRGKEQIVIGLVMADGIPIYHEVWPGNTVDPKTLESTISVLRDRFKIKNVIFIADRAFGRSKSLDLLDQNLYITAAYRWDQPYRSVLMETDFTGGQEMNDLIIKRVTINVDDVLKEDSTADQRKLAEKRKYIAVYNKEREELDLKDLNNKIDIVKKKISEITDQKELKKSLGKLKSLVKFTVNGPMLNEKRTDILRRLAGRFLIVTNTDLKEDKVVSAYKEQWQIERSFRTVKSFLEIRPVYHRKSDRIKAHVFVCILALLFSRIIEKRLKGGDTMERISKTMDKIQIAPVVTPEGTIMVRTESDEAEMLLSKFGIPMPGRIMGMDTNKE